MIGCLADKAKGLLLTRLLEMSRLTTAKADGVHIGHLISNIDWTKENTMKGEIED
jgi:hypothetical protein